jgi:hypothetical protein
MIQRIGIAAGNTALTEYFLKSTWVKVDECSYARNRSMIGKESPKTNEESFFALVY